MLEGTIEGAQIIKDEQPKGGLIFNTRPYGTPLPPFINQDFEKWFSACYNMGTTLKDQNVENGFHHATLHWTILDPPLPLKVK